MTTKPVLYIANVDEDVVSDPDSIEYVKQIREFAATENAEVVVISARAEEEISELDDEDKQEFLEALGLTESGVDKLTRAAYHLLGLGTYFTAGEKEVRTWTFKRGMKAPQAAGIIHSDFEKGFIRAVTMSYEDLVKYGSEKAVKEAGRLRRLHDALQRIHAGEADCAGSGYGPDLDPLAAEIDEVLKIGRAHV